MAYAGCIAVEMALSCHRFLSTLSTTQRPNGRALEGYGAPLSHSTRHAAATSAEKAKSRSQVDLRLPLQVQNTTGSSLQSVLGLMHAPGGVCCKSSKKVGLCFRAVRGRNSAQVRGSSAGTRQCLVP